MYKVKKGFENTSVEMKIFPGNLLCSPDDLLKKDGSPYLVYTAFWNNFIKKYKVKKIDKPKKLSKIPSTINEISCTLEELNLISGTKHHENFKNLWSPGEDKALKKTRSFIRKDLLSYNRFRDFPSNEGTSKLSPHLHFGEIHPQRVLYLIYKKFGELSQISDVNIKQFCKEILWREFSYHLLKHFPRTEKEPLREAFKSFPWRNNNKKFTLWTQGKTGYPMVDAGMRQLLTTGWMHNRVRMITASFLVKHLGIPWQEGAKWFLKTLLDADLANNTQGWQWVAGCGADAAPFFRIFNPITQGEKFDPKGYYVSHWCPELKNLPSQWIYRPWEAPQDVLLEAKVSLGDNYPYPIVDHKIARNKALWDYESIK